MKSNKILRVVVSVLLALSILILPACGKKAMFKPGTYHAEVPVMGEEICIVDVTFTDNAIEKIVAEKTNGGDKVDEVFVSFPDLIVEKQSVSQVDTIAGSTMSVDAFKEAVLNCIEQAGGDPSKF